MSDYGMLVHNVQAGKMRSKTVANYVVPGIDLKHN